MMALWNGLTFRIIDPLCVVSLWIPSTKGKWCTVVVIPLLLAWVSICTNSRLAGEIRHSYDVTLMVMDESELLVTFSLINIHMSEMVELHPRERPGHCFICTVDTMSADGLATLMPWRLVSPGHQQAWCWPSSSRVLRALHVKVKSTLISQALIPSRRRHLRINAADLTDHTSVRSKNIYFGDEEMIITVTS